VTDDIDSPCDRICIVETASGFCRGCYRTLHEISYWARFTRIQKLALLEEVAKRRTAAAALEN
jgi:predicted Fe-S protein YdhL (DUF1289 family)